VGEPDRRRGAAARRPAADAKDALAEVVVRLRRAQGQIGGVIQMIEDGPVDLRSRTAFRGWAPARQPVLGLDGSFATHLGWLIPWGTPLTLLGESAEQVAEAQRELVRIGIDRPVGAATGTPSPMRPPSSTTLNQSWRLWARHLLAAPPDLRRTPLPRPRRDACRALYSSKGDQNILCIRLASLKNN
jgi:hypothetical protein